MPKLDKKHESMPVEENDALESVQVDQGERHAADLRIPQANGGFSDHQISTLVPEPVLEQIPVASFSSSPNSALEPKFSMHQSSLSSCNENMHVDIQQIDKQMAENSMLDEARSEGLISTIPQSTVLSTEDSKYHLFHGGDDQILQESSHLSSSTKEANSSMGSVIQGTIHEDKRRQNQAMNISKGSSENWNNREPTTALSTLKEEVCSRTLTETDDRSEELLHHEGPVALVNPIPQVDQLNTPFINIREVTEYEENPVGVSYRGGITNSAVEGEDQASSNAATSKDSEDSPSGPKEFAVGIDRTEILLGLSRGSMNSYPSTPADETKPGFSEPFDGESRICGAQEITAVEPSKAIYGNNSSSDHTANTQIEMPANTSSERYIEEVTGNPSTYEMVVNRLEEQSKDQQRTLKEALKD